MLVTMASTYVNLTFKRCFVKSNVSFVSLSPVVIMNCSRLIQQTHPIDSMGGADCICHLFSKRLQIGDAYFHSQLYKRGSRRNSLSVKINAYTKGQVMIKFKFSFCSEKIPGWLVVPSLFQCPSPMT